MRASDQYTSRWSTADHRQRQQWTVTASTRSRACWSCACSGSTRDRRCRSSSSAPWRSSVDPRRRRAGDGARAQPAATIGSRGGDQVRLAIATPCAGDVRDKIALTTATPASRPSRWWRAPDRWRSATFRTPRSCQERAAPAAPADMPRSSAARIEGPGAFIATINGKPRIMIRTGGTTKTGRTQIKSLYGPPIAVMMGAESVREAVEARRLVRSTSSSAWRSTANWGRGE
jgi:hypothetical protein